MLIAYALGVVAYYGVRYYNEKKVAERKAIIDNLLLAIDEKYKAGTLEEITSVCDQLDGLGYDTTKTREILKYDLGVRDDIFIS